MAGVVQEEGNGSLPRQATPTFLPVAGIYGTTQNVAISSASADNIYYTDDGTTPTNPPSGSTQTYSGPVSVATSQTLKAIAVRAGYSDSLVGTAAYTIGAVPLAVVQTALVNEIPSHATPSILTFGSPCATGNSIYIFMTYYSASACIPLTVTDDAGNIYTQITGPDGTGASSGFTNNYIWKCENIIGTPTVITVTESINQYRQLTAVEVSGGAAGYSVVDNFTYASCAAVSSPQPVVGPDITTAAADELLLGYVVQENAGYTFTPGTGWTAVVTNSNPANASSFLMSQAAAVAGLYSQTGGTISSASGSGIYSLALV